jgi:transcriptional regulator with GAF, ATPase, and Fis domain
MTTPTTTHITQRPVIDINELAGGNPDLARIIKSNLPRTLSESDNIAVIDPSVHKVLQKFITIDPETRKTLDKVAILASIRRNEPVLITGESGTGKELVARALHGERYGRFVGINCTSLPAELLESEMFGHMKGSFTGAVSDKQGKFQYAENGTLFLDEIGDMPLILQAKLLRVLQERKIVRLGGNDEEPVNCRIIAATNQSIRTSKEFRLDLFYRLAVFTIHIRPLRERPEDVKEIIKILDPKGEFPVELIPEGYHWPGNVRELQAVIKNYSVLGSLPEWFNKKEGNDQDFDKIFNEGVECAREIIGNLPDLNQP